ncbi:hypothetical protein VTK73DRAFT_4 [Phialemonium thermophilum]|uniref:A-kinase anchor protein 7-like phosphoesterase domain-containing protein n=1 Tax=Phialemonium thermophilum TaxID=223376 RepID=A0ABR3Y8L0_9PEZI
MPPKPFPTHFLCVPIVTPSSRPQLALSLEAFAVDVTNPASFGVPREAIRPVGTLHLTLGVFAFPRDKDEGLKKATQLLKSLKVKDLLPTPVPPAPIVQAGEKPTATGPPTLTLRGLASMQSVHKTSVLYAPPVDPDGTLQAFCERVRRIFQEAGLLVEDTRPLLLHATILNTVYAKGVERSEGVGQPRKSFHRRRERLTIDAQGILERYEDQVWLENFKVTKIAICKMGANKIVVDGVEDEVYEVVAETDIYAT